MNTHTVSRPLRLLALSYFAVLAAACGEQAAPEAAAPAATELTALQTPPPQYPLEAACSGHGGVSTLKVTVGTAGTPTEVVVAKGSGNAALDDAAVAAVKQWTFKPATRGGQPVAQTLNVPVNFPAPQVRPDACFSLDEKAKTPAQ
ncbi:energy transducer TonB [Pseudoxanthomonas winnipegensis]|uniref:energy transducer TonB n=1 Tax=Pseudoxanthomonas winnipegensis TaxID=2480810 RepID=UPI00103934E2|nr:energy transducer TonB [Pseudoxanthomonas winnipegensis]TBV73435.1 energy transducer TonB [Pseudoxanthomonas winnipegensis]